MEEQVLKFIQSDCPDGGFLQSEEWIRFQEAYGRKTHNISGTDFWANAIEHQLPLVGKYLYVPRGPLGKAAAAIPGLIELAKQTGSGWIRIEPVSESALEAVRRSLSAEIEKAPHEMQPKEVFSIDIRKGEEDLLAAMKPKTRYNIRLAEKKGVSTAFFTKQDGRGRLDDFLKLVRITSERQGINSHPEDYYRKMWETLPEGMLRLYLAEYESNFITANLVLFFGKWATYLHGASDNTFREAMAPYLLQWKAIQDAKAAGCEHYDFGGIDTSGQKSGWEGITRFKTGFAPEIRPTVFPGTYDIIISGGKYRTYRFLQKIKNIRH